MRACFSRTILILSSRFHFVNPINNAEFHSQAFRISHFSTSSSPFHSSSSSSSSSSSYSSRRHDEDSRNVRVSVWWDFENCTLPAGANVFKVAQSITAAVRASGIRGSIQITAFGDVMQLSRSNQEALSATGINLTHVPNGGKNSADRSLLVDLMYWVSQNPPPAHLFLISGDRDFANILHRLRMSNYNVLLASQDTAPNVLCSAASIMWNWKELVKGERLTGKHFNQPPDGPYGSWYGQYRVRLEDPFAVTEQPACSHAEEVPESSSDPKLRTVPRAVMRQIRQILNFYPKGISITELRLELGKRNICIDKDYYGYKKFSRFLLSMTHILKVQSGGDGQVLVRSIAPKIPEQVEQHIPSIATGTVTNKEEPDVAITTKVNGQSSSSTKCLDEKPSLPTKLNVEKPPSKSQEAQKQFQEPCPLDKKVNNPEVTHKHLHPVEGNSSSEIGFFTRMWKKWFGSKDGVHAKKSLSSGSCNENTSTEEKSEKSTRQSTDPIGPTSFFSPSYEPAMGDKLAWRDEAHGDKASRDNGLFNQIFSWCRFWRKSPNFENSSEQPSEKVNQVTVDSGNHAMFSKESFWNEMEAYINTPPNGSVLVLQSRSREEMAQNLRKQGPLILRSLSQNDLLHLVDLLISKKKWVEECCSQTYPFKIMRPAGKCPNVSNPPNSNGLRSIFMNSTSRSSSQGLPEHDGERMHQNLPHSRASLPVINKKPLGKSRNEILGDCQKLVDDIVKEYPEGFNISSFRKLFLERFGYPLDIQQVGYQKLATLLQIMPGVKVESTCMMPCNFSKSSGLESGFPSVQENNISAAIANSDGDLSDADASGKDDDYLDSPWEELGPVANSGPNQNKVDLELKSRAKDETARWINHDYQTLSDYSTSDSDEDTSSPIGSEGQKKPRIDEEDSSLLKILDSWYSNKETSREGGLENADRMVDCSQDVLKPYSSSGTGINTETLAVKCGRKERPFKNYSFVSDHVGNNKDQLIDGILGSLKKSRESRLQG